MLGLFPPGLEPRTFRVLGERDNHYTTETNLLKATYHRNLFERKHQKGEKKEKLSQDTFGNWPSKV